MEEALELALKSGEGIIWCSTLEEGRTCLRIQVVAEQLGYASFRWSCTEGFAQLSSGDLRPPGNGRCTNVGEALRAAAEYTSTRTCLSSRISTRSQPVWNSRRIGSGSCDRSRTLNCG